MKIKSEKKYEVSTTLKNSCQSETVSALKPSLLSNQFDTQCNKIRHLHKESSLDINRDELIIMA